MTDNAFRADPGTALIFADPEQPVIPILGWHHTGAGNRVWPLTPVLRKNGMVAGEAIAFPNGSVFDPVLSMTFADETDWRNYLGENTPYEVGTHVSAETVPPKAAAREPGKRGPAPKEYPLLPASNFEWGTKTYKNASFWQAPESGVFLIEGGCPVPSSGAVKITREEFYSLRKTVPEYRIAEAEAEPELPLGVPDDMDDVI